MARSMLTFNADAVIHGDVATSSGSRTPPAAFLGAALALALAGCTSLGPMPGTTAVAPLAAGRPSFEAQFGYVPGYFLSSAVKEKPEGASISQAALLVEPDSIIHVPGLVVGGRYVGDASKGGYPEPLLGYRTFVDADKRIAVSAVGYATHGTGETNGASYSATRGGLEAGVDVRVTPESQWLELHALAATSLTGLSAEGTYCVGDAQGTYGIDCPEMMPVFRPSKAKGFYPAVIGSLTLDTGRHFKGEFHGVRLGLLVGAGTMPRVVAAAQESAKSYASAGLTLSVAFGEGR